MRGEMPVDAVVRDVGLAACKPLREWGVPLEHVRPLFEPVQFALGQFAPELLRLVGGTLVELAILLHSFDVRARGELRTRRKNVLIGHTPNLIRMRLQPGPK